MTKVQQGEDYWVYENWRADGHKARVHLGDCPFCNHGRGIHPLASDDNGRWHGPFATLGQARQAASGLGRNVSECRKCLARNANSSPATGI